MPLTPEISVGDAIGVAKVVVSKAVELQQFTLFSGTTAILIALFFSVFAYGFAAYNAYQLVKDGNKTDTGILQIFWLYLLASVISPIGYILLGEIYTIAFNIDSQELLKTALSWDYETIINSPKLNHPLFRSGAFVHYILSSITPYLLVSVYFLNLFVGVAYASQYFNADLVFNRQFDKIWSRIFMVSSTILVFLFLSFVYSTLANFIYFSNGNVDFISFKDVSSLHDLLTTIVANSIKLAMQRAF